MNRQNWKSKCHEYVYPSAKVWLNVSDKFATRSNLIEGAVPTISPSKLKTPSCRNRHGVRKHTSCSTVKLLEASVNTRGMLFV